MPTIFLKKLQEYFTTSNKANHRLLLVLSGEREHCWKLLHQALSALNIDTPLLINAPSTEPLSTPIKLKSLLGLDTDCIVYDTYDGFDPDGFGILSGSIKGGGLCVLITPELALWPKFLDPQASKLAVYPLESKDVSTYYLSRLARIIKNDLSSAESIQQVDCRVLKPRPFTKISALEPLPTTDQCIAIDAIKQQLNLDIKTPAPLLITSDRGRGKSSAMGIAAGALLKTKMASHILICAPTKKTAQNLLLHAANSLQLEVKELAHHGLHFIAPDALLNEHVKTDLLLIDEAASIPLPLLKNIVALYKNCVFSSTLHGYEGSGRGFAVRFTQLLSQQYANWKQCKLTTPIRFAAHDPFEAFTEKLLLLDTVVQPQVIKQVCSNEFNYQQISAKELLNNEALLRSLFALLVQSHYQTKPLDLRHILDGPNISIHLLKNKNTIVAAAMLATEQLVDEHGLFDNIIHGQRRPRGHLLPQLLAYQFIQKKFLDIKTARIVRIAVHPELQNKGLGSYLMKHLQSWCKKQSVEILGSSFGITNELLSFWTRNKFLPLHLGSRINASSACLSVAVVQALTPTVKPLLVHCQKTFQLKINFRSRLNTQNIPNNLLISSIKTDKRPELFLQEVQSYSSRGRDFESSHYALSIFFNQHRDSLQQIPAINAEVVKKIFFDQNTWSQTSQRLNLQGRKHCEVLLKEAIKCLSKNISSI
jgi:tRNA(Met) cytidine acetyltransferase